MRPLSGAARDGALPSRRAGLDMAQGGPGPPDETRCDREGFDMRINQICTHAVVSCHRDTSALEIAKMMRDRHVGDIIVVDNTGGGAVPVGIVTDRDLVVQVMARSVDPDLV